ncbi:MULTISPECIES: hypothetical protein [unclassified Corynebacterium]|uniref:hypothetical protein n=1 Tax=unclassified Corynebacterium TaxID=2624378 RepID=UPI0029CA7A53|nr:MULTISPECIES: hypothetical protein [unclassified Corynebacterium]WPF65407.1 hypothetical protein OLX12_07430 [Corynebacterium sp. 22KM0430]WPF67902.1 hypothetical protein OLW90_07420 [Corynebacterium sp. 21KM1197]
MTEPMTVHLPEDMRERVVGIARIADCSSDEIIRRAVEYGLDRAEWEVHILEQVRQIRSGEQKTFSVEEIDEMLGIAGEPGEGALEDIR